MKLYAFSWHRAARLALSLISGLLAIGVPSPAFAQADNFATEILALERSVGAPEGALDFYVGVSAPEILLHQIAVQIDGGPLQRYSYSQDQALALQNRGLHRLTLNTAIGPGEHRVWAELIARHVDDKPGVPRLRRRVDQVFQKSAGREAVLLDLADQSFGREAAIQFRQWAVSPGAPDPAELRVADFLIDSGRPFAAARELTGLQARYGGLAPDYQQRLANSMTLLQGGVVPEPASPLLAQYQAASTAFDLAALDRIGQTKVDDPASWTLKDKANTALGFYYLQQRQGALADGVFRRVRSPGPYSSSALLGLGWAQLMPAGKDGPASAEAIRVSMQPTTPDEVAAARRMTPFRYAGAIASDKRADDIHRALVPWAELLGRDPLDPAVQEGVLSIPYALAHLGAQNQAQDYQVRAIDLMEHTHTHLNNALKHVASGRMSALLLEKADDPASGWPAWIASLPEPRWWLTAPPAAPENFYLENLATNDEFRRQLQKCRQLREYQAVLETNAGDPRAAGLSARVAAAMAGERQRLEALATAELKRLHQQTERYLVEARFALARLHDPAPARGEAR